MAWLQQPHRELPEARGGLPPDAIITTAPTFSAWAGVTGRGGGDRNGSARSVGPRPQPCQAPVTRRLGLQGSAGRRGRAGTGEVPGGSWAAVVVREDAGLPGSRQTRSAGQVTGSCPWNGVGGAPRDRNGKGWDLGWGQQKTSLGNWIGTGRTQRSPPSTAFGKRGIGAGSRGSGAGGSVGSENAQTSTAALSSVKTGPGHQIRWTSSLPGP